MKYLLFTALALLTLTSRIAAQQSTAVQPAPEAPNNDLILAEIVSSASPYNYTALITRYIGGDTTLTLQDYRHLYYGFAWQPEYEPLTTPSVHAELLSIFENEEHGEQDYLDIIEKGNELMKWDPFRPSTINFLIYAYGAIGDTVNEQINYYRLTGIKAAIFSSGTGLKESSPWHVIHADHARDIIGSLNVVVRKPMIVSRTTEYFPLSIRDSQGNRGYYFNYERMYWKRPDQLPEKRSAGWEFNGIPIKKR